MDLRFYGLLVAPLREERAVNLAARHDPLDVYLRCAALCWRSFTAAGYDWQLVTDHRARLEARCAALGIAGLPLREVPFAWDMPADLRFRSAHYKLELMTNFASGNFGERVALVDLDAVCLHALPSAVAQGEGLVGYDLTAVAVASDGGATIADSLSRLAGAERRAQWWGGEFLAGRAEDFARLAEHIEALWPAYLSAHATMVHVGDEMVLTAALQGLTDEGRTVSDGGSAGALARYWSARTTLPMERFGAIADRAILHLPADKPFLASYQTALGAGTFDSAHFLAAYRAYLRRRIPPRRIAAMLALLTGGTRRHAPRL